MLNPGQSDNKDRPPAVAGTFYSADPDTLSQTIKDLVEAKSKDHHNSLVRAVIAPHAGYIFSGPVAASAYAHIQDWQNYKRIFIIGSSHRHRFKGAAMYSDGNFITPLGKVKVDREICQSLQNKSILFTNYPEAHLNEHTIEVQLPFLQYFLGDSLSIVPILIGTDKPEECELIANELTPWFSIENLFVFSSDFSHYPGYNNAVELDTITSEKIINNAPEEFIGWIKECEKKHSYGAQTPMCGWTSGLVMMYLARKEQKANFIHLDYSNSGDSRIGDKNGVVGYHAIALVEKIEKEFIISDSERLELLTMARENIHSRLTTGKFMPADEKELGGILGTKLGAFVSLRLNNKLRGCIGKLNATESLYETIRQMSVAAAFNDSRFDPLTLGELENVVIEISILGEMRKIEDIDDIIPGKHGVYLKKGMVTATFLPQVATEQNWNRDELLGNLAKNKAGLGWLGWKDADIYIYEAIIFEESIPEIQ